MSKIKSLVVALHSYQYASKEIRGGGDDIEHSVKIGTTMMVALPSASLAAALLSVVAPLMGHEEFKGVMVIAALISVFGFSFFTDRVYDRSASEIKALAVGIHDDPEKGRNWARQKVAGIYLAQFACIALIAAVGRAYVIYGTDLPFISM
jgi:hypothetical protein